MNDLKLDSKSRQVTWFFQSINFEILNAPVYPGPSHSRHTTTLLKLLRRVPMMAPFMMRMKHPSKKCFLHNSPVLILLRNTSIELGKQFMGLLIIPYHLQLLLPKQN